MKKRISNIWNKYHISFIISLIAPLLMTIIHFVSLAKGFSVVVLCYMIFSFFIFLGRVFMGLMSSKDNIKGMFLVSILTIISVLAPLGISLYKTVTDMGAPVYIFDWLIYGYAVYAFWKMGSAIYNLIKNKKNEKIAFGLISLTSASFTIFMLEFKLIKTFSPNSNFFGLILSTQIVVILLVLSILVYLIVRYIKFSRRI